jgi:hypothetical protein
MASTTTNGVKASVIKDVSPKIIDFLSKETDQEKVHAVIRALMSKQSVDVVKADYGVHQPPTGKSQTSANNSYTSMAGSDGHRQSVSVSLTPTKKNDGGRGTKKDTDKSDAKMTPADKEKLCSVIFEAAAKGVPSSMEKVEALQNDLIDMLSVHPRFVVHNLSEEEVDFISAVIMTKLLCREHVTTTTGTTGACSVITKGLKSQGLDFTIDGSKRALIAKRAMDSLVPDQDPNLERCIRSALARVTNNEGATSREYALQTLMMDDALFKVILCDCTTNEAGDYTPTQEGIERGKIVLECIHKVFSVADMRSDDKTMYLNIAHRFYVGA